MKLFYAEDTSFFMLSFEDGKPSNTITSVAGKATQQCTNNPLDASQTTCQQVFIFNQSFILEQVILAMDSDVIAAIGLPLNDEKVVELLDRIREKVHSALTSHTSPEFDQILSQELIDLITKIKHSIRREGMMSAG